MPTNLFVEVIIYDKNTDNEIESYKFDYNDMDARKTYLTNFHQMLKDETLAIEISRVKHNE